MILKNAKRKVISVQLLSSKLILSSGSPFASSARPLPLNQQSLGQAPQRPVTIDPMETPFLQSMRSEVQATELMPSGSAGPWEMSNASMTLLHAMAQQAKSRLWTGLLHQIESLPQVQIKRHFVGMHHFSPT